MSRHARLLWALVLSGSTLATGCQPVQPFFFKEDRDLSHYVGMATDIEYPDVDQPTPPEVACAQPPLTLRNSEDFEVWELSLEEVTRITLENGQVMRQLGGLTISPIVGGEVQTIARTLISPVAVATIYDTALIESSTGTATGSQFGGTGTEAALAAFDAQLDASITWNKNDVPQNRVAGGVGGLFSPEILHQDLGTFTTGITKVTATGTQFSFRNNTDYEANNLPSFPDPNAFQAYPSAWRTNFEASFSHPFFQGQGTQYNRIAGPFSFNQYAAGATNPIDGVIIARLRTDQSLADFEGGVRNVLCDVEDAYWTLYFAYRDLQARKLGRDSALETWKNVHAKFITGSIGGSADREAQARSQYFLFRSQVEEALTQLFQAEANLRYIMGLAESDGRLIRPADEPTTASVHFDWHEIVSEAMVRRVELRKQKWQVKQRELELIAARNHLLPRLDAVGTYRWRGIGDELLGDGAARFTDPGSTAFDLLTKGDFQEWQLGLQFSMPIGFRQQISTVRHHQLLLARERAILRELELEVSHQLGTVIRSLDSHYRRTETFFNRRVAAEREVQTVNEVYLAGRTSLDQLLDAQRRRAEAESDYYRSLVDYNKLIMLVHCRKGSALEYNGVYLAEGPWPGKAYFDALRRARQRDASMYLDYGFTRPRVVSRGPYRQSCGPGAVTGPHGQPAPGETMAPDEVESPRPGLEEVFPREGAPGAGSSSAAGDSDRLTAEGIRFEEPKPWPEPHAGGPLSMVPSDRLDIGLAFEENLTINTPERLSPPRHLPPIVPSKTAVPPTPGVLPSAHTNERQAHHSIDQAAASAAGWQRAQRQQSGEFLRR